MEKKEYLPPKMEVVEMPSFGGILCQSPCPEVIPVEDDGEDES